MIWDDPWTMLAMQKGGTTIPPPRTPLATGQEFRCVREKDLAIGAWIDLVGTRWSESELRLRLADAWIPCLFVQGDLVATCVLRVRGRTWILETLRAIKGFGTALLRSTIPWIYDRDQGFTLTYTWELSLPGLVAAWWRGWLTSAAVIQYGYAWSPVTDGSCNFCPSKWTPVAESRLALPTLFQDASGLAIISDSGLGDGWGYVSLYRGEPSWSVIAERGGWRALWMRSCTAPKIGWSWTGEFIVGGVLNSHGAPCLEWVTAEIAV